MSQKKENSIANTAVSLTFVLALSKIFGFMRSVALTAKFGTGELADAFNTASKYTALLQALITASVVATFIPAYTGIISKKGKQDADRFTSKLMTFMMLLTGVVAILSIIFADAICMLFAQGYDEEQRRMTASIIRIMAPLVFFVSAMVIYQNYLNAHRRHVESQLVGFPLNIISILFIVGLSGTLGIYSAAWGTMLGTVAQAFLLWLFVRKSFKFRLQLDMKDEDLRRMLRLMVPALISAAATDISTAVDTILATDIPRGVSALEYAWRLNNLVIGSISVAATSIVYTRLSGFATENDMDSFKSMLRNGIMTVIAVLAPIVVVCCVMDVDIVRVAFQRNNFQEESVAITSYAFLYYAPAILGTALRDIMVRSFYALGDTRTPLVNGLVTVTLNVALNFILVKVMGVGGLALATSIAMFFAGGLTATRLSRRVGGLGLQMMVNDLLKTLACLALQIVVAIVVTSALSASGPFLRLVAGAGSSLAAYAVLGYIINAPAIRHGVGMVTRRLSRK